MARTLRKTIELSRASQTTMPKKGCAPGGLSRLELQCMKVIWLNRATTVAEVQQCLSPLRPLAYTTVLTVLDRLAKKGAVSRVKRGKAHVYEPALSFETSRDEAIAGLVDFYFQGSAEKLIDYLGNTNRASQPASYSGSEGKSPSDISTMQDCLL
jgi:predicted transcriptional regulator